MKKRDIEDIYPLSPMQESIFLHTLLDPESEVYFIQIYFDIINNFDVHSYENAFQEMVNRHTILRTGFIWQKVEKPLQVVYQSVKIPFNHYDWRNKDTDDFGEELEEFLIADRRQGFKFDQAPLMRCSLIRLSDDKYHFVFSFHHLIMDGWSKSIFFKEIFELYDGYCSGREMILEHAEDYRSFIAWLMNQDKSSAEAFWRDYLQGIESPTAIGLPEISGKFNYSEKNFKNLRIQLTTADTKRLESFVREHNITLNILFQGAWSLLLSLYSGDEDVVFGTVISGRSPEVPEIESMIGLFINTLPLRVNIKGDDFVIQWLKRLHADNVERDLYSYCSLTDIQKWSAVPQDMPLFESGFAFENYPSDQGRFQNRGDDNLKGTNKLKITNFNVFECTDYPLAIVVTPGKKMRLIILYDCIRFDKATIASIAEHFRVLLEEITINPIRRISEISPLTDVERHQMLVEWNETATEYPRNECIHQLFEKQVERMPDTVSMIFEDNQITYQELNIRSNQLANYLRKRYVGPASIVAIMEEQTTDIIITILGILKTGAAYLPIDIQNPIDRTLFILNDTKTSVLLTESHIIKDIPFNVLKNLSDINEKIFITPKREQIMDLDMLPIPDRSLVDYNRYDQYIGEGCVMKSISILATRGCPYNCLYCHKIWPKRHVVRSAQNIFQEIKKHYENGYDTFNILDDIFNLNKKNSENLFNLVIKNNMKIRILFPNGLRGDLLTPDYIDLMSEAGVMQMALALETASPRLQKLIRKNLNLKKLRENLLYICKKHPHIIMDLFVMFGFPTETEEEALMTLDFIYGIKWIHFPVLSALKIFPNTDMARLAIEHGVSLDKIEKSSDSAYHEISDVMPFSKSFSSKFQAEYLNKYFLNTERLSYVIPIQKKVLTREEIIAKYNSYLPGSLENYKEILDLIGSDNCYLEDVKANKENGIEILNLSSQGKGIYDDESKINNKLNILLLDLSQHFSYEADTIFNVVEPPLGLMYLMTYLNREFGKTIKGKIAKAMIEFDNYVELKTLINDFSPHVIGIRTLSLYKSFFHKTISLIKLWFPDVPIITGGPYATSEYTTILGDGNIDVVVIGEGELTLAEIIRKMINNNGKLPGDDVLKKIPGLAFVPKEEKIELKKLCIGRDVILLDKIEEVIEQEGKDNLLNFNHAHESAYIMYTSGSTGTPKGIMVHHQAIMRLVINTNYIKLKESDSIAFSSNVSFDAATFEIWGALLNGARLVILGRDIILSPERFEASLSVNRVNVIFLTTALFNQIAKHAPRAFRDIRYLLFGGEAVDPSSVREVLEKDPPENLLHVYGPTENTTFSSWFLIDEVAEGATTIPIGRPISNTQLFVLDSNLHPVPIGSMGELFIMGTGLSQGYINRPELTAATFLPSPFGMENGSRIYKSGDVVCYLLNGVINFIGRIDEQVKIRGYRIELGEIGAVLSEQPGVRENVVLAREDIPGDKRLVAYIVPTQGQEPSAPEIRDYMKEKLPDYMIPSAFVMLDEIPLSPNGKVDRKSLPLPDSSGLEKEYIPPQNEIEKKVAEIWQNILNIKKVGAYDNFFEIGGNSLIATQVISRIREIFSVDISIRSAFENPTVAELSEVIEKYLFEKEDPLEMAKLIKKIELLSEEKAMGILNTNEKVLP